MKRQQRMYKTHQNDVDDVDDEDATTVHRVEIIHISKKCIKRKYDDNININCTFNATDTSIRSGSSSDRSDKLLYESKECVKSESDSVRKHA